LTSNQKSLESRDLFLNATPWATQTMVFFVDPLSQRQGCRFSFPVVVNLVMFAFRVLGTTVFAEPAIA
jgi:hypothetical protein